MTDLTITAAQAKRWLEQGREALQRAIVVAGGQEPFANRLKIRQSLVWYWLERAKFGVPAEKTPLIEAHFGIPREELRPDIFLAFRSPEKSQPMRAAS
jgi:DNA-binding transcriptional regulator YdaS (Cro superfamily)